MLWALQDRLKYGSAWADTGQGAQVMNRHWLLSITLTVVSTTVLLGHMSQPARQVGNDGFVITGVRLFDGQQTRSSQNVVVTDGLIRAVVDNPREWRDLRAIDGSGATLLPGFIDAHAHTFEVAGLQQALRFGVTTVLDMATGQALEPELRRAAASRMDVADFRSAGILATAPGGHGTEYGFDIPTVAGPADAAAFVRARKAAGADYLKIVLNGVRAAREGTPTLDRATTEALVHEAHSLDMLVISHVESIQDVRTAVMSGVDGLAHVWREGGAAPEVAELVARRNVFVVPTVVAPEGFVKGSGTLLADDSRWRAFLTDAVRARLTGPVRGPVFENIDAMLAAVHSLHEAGARLLTGTDVPNGITVHGISLHRELELLVKAGLRPEEVLTAATTGVATAFRLPDRGTIAPGRRADLVLVRGDPTKDITATRDILRVWRSGVEFDRSLKTVASVQPRE
jgi:imidazolonepropionase-like amidohydrolase